MVYFQGLRLPMVYFQGTRLPMLENSQQAGFLLRNSLSTPSCPRARPSGSRKQIIRVPNTPADYHPVVMGS